MTFTLHENNPAFGRQVAHTAYVHTWKGDLILKAGKQTFQIKWSEASVSLLLP